MRIILLMIALCFCSVVLAQCLKGDCQNGHGTYRYADGTTYIGDFKNNLPNGRGICYFKEGDTYVGEWRNKEFHGRGAYHLKNGQSMRGIWEKGKLITPRQSPMSKTENSKVFALIVGVSDYDKVRDLKYADNDAYLVYAHLKSPEGGSVPDHQIHLLVDENANEMNILRSLDMISQEAGKDDIIFLFFSGHGLPDAFLPSDYNHYGKKITYETIAQRLGESKSANKICMIDACHSGGMEEFAYKNISEEEETVNGNTLFILSSKANENSVESSGFRQSVFSHFLVKGLKGEANENQDGVITITELSKYLIYRVFDHTEGAQLPTIISNHPEDFIISTVKIK